MNICITADSTCDLSKELIDRFGIRLFPITIVTDGVLHHDGIDISEQDLYEYADRTGHLATTAASNPFEYGEFFDSCKQGHDALIHIALSSGFSSCASNAALAASERENVYVVDSKNLSTGSGHLVLDAAEMALSGMDAASIAEKLNRTAELVEASFVIDTLTYLHKGGRCSALAALGANILGFKPCIEVVGGKMTVGKKYRGSYKNVILKYVSDRLTGRDDIDTSRIFITHTSTSRDICDAVIEEVKKLKTFDSVLETDAGPTIACHCGPCTLGILFKRKS